MSLNIPNSQVTPTRTGRRRSRWSPSSSGSGTPASNVDINDSDHLYFGLWNDSAQTNRNYVWENFTNGNQVVFMDPYLVFAGASNGSWTNRNNCDNNVAPAHGVCTVPDTRWDNFRNNMGYTVSYGERRGRSLCRSAAMQSSTWLTQRAITKNSIFNKSGGKKHC